MYITYYILYTIWACKHWKFQNNYFVIVLHFCCIWVCRFGFVLYFFVICLLFLLLFWERENKEKKSLKLTTITDLLLSHGSTKYKERVQKLLESQPAVKKDRAGELALGNSFWACLDEKLFPGVQGRLKNRWGRRGEMARKAAQAREASKNATLPACESFYFLFLRVFCIF